jgi:beta-glucosidase
MALLFPPHFQFGASTAAYQIEGAWDADGKGESIWDRFAHSPGRIADGKTGDIACDHYHRYEADLDLAKAAGLSCYRFSIAWTRLFPNGVGARNVAGFDFYNRLVDACLVRGLEPWPCFYHWDLPQALEDQDGWANPEAPHWFGDYAQAAARALGDRVSTFILFNEPSMFTSLGYLLGLHAPGRRDAPAWMRAVHHVNQATALAFASVKAVAPSAALGTVLALNQMTPASENLDDHAATRRADAVFNRAFADPIFLGRYPNELADLGDASLLKTPIDFLGVNHYTRVRIKADQAAPMGLRMAATPGDVPQTHYRWEIRPEGMRDILNWVRQTYGSIPIVVTENGAACPDKPAPDGFINDQDRIAFLDTYIRAVAQAIVDGCDVRGYFIWSLLDNFEWQEGYQKRFGLAHVDFETLQRTPKASFDWYAQLAKSKTLP